MRRLSALVFWLCSVVALARSQSIDWDPPGGRLAVGQAVALRLVCRDCEPTSAPTLPKVPGLQSSYQGPSSSMMDNNGAISQTISYNFAILWPKHEVLVLPAFDVPTNHGMIHVAEARFEPAEATIGNSGKPLSAAANAQLNVHPNSIWAGQVVPLEFRVQAQAQYRPDFVHQAPNWSADTLVAEEWSRPESFDAEVDGETFTGLAYRTRIVAPRPGDYEIHPASQLVSLSVGLAMFGFFQSPQFQQYSIASSPAQLHVKELPPPPPGFSGAVGHFQLTSKVVPTSAAVREPITWTLELSGTGNWPQIDRLPVRSASKDFEVVHPQLQHTAAPGKIFDAKLAEDVVLVPTKAGNYVLPAVRFVYFDPSVGEYRTISSPESEVEIEAPAGGTPNPAAESTSAAGAAATLTAPPLPAALPRDPLPTGGRATTPLPWNEWALGALVVPAVLLAALWVILARERALLTDPARPRREARRRLSQIVRQIGDASQSGTAPVPRALLLSWQQDAVRWRQLNRAVPSPAAFGDPGWAGLADDVDRALYGPTGLLPAGWTTRAGEALAAERAPRFRSALLFRPRNLFPFLFGLCLCGAALSARAAAPLSAYQAGDFAAAEKGWRSQSQLDPAVRHNLSLALAQQDRWPEAAAQAGAAFVQDPSNPVIRAEFLTACERAGVAPGPLTGFLTPSPLQRWAESFSPGGWQCLAITAAAVLAAGLALGLVASYRTTTRRWTKPAAFVLVLLGAGGAGGGVAGWLAYGTARDLSAVWVVNSGSLRSIPTEADGKQATVPVTAGSIGTVDKTFLSSWVRLRFPNGTTGWMQRGDVVTLWK